MRRRSFRELGDRSRRVGLPSFEGLVGHSELLQDLFATQPFLLGNEIPAQDTEYGDSAEDNACLDRRLP